MPKHTQWCVIFYDLQSRAKYQDNNNDGLTPVEAVLTSIHWNLKTQLKIDGTLSKEKLFLINNVSHKDDNNIMVGKGACYRYVHYFKLIGKTDGYDEKMFCTKKQRPMTGVKMFCEQGFEIEEVYKGRNAWKMFNDVMLTEVSMPANDFTKAICDKTIENQTTEAYKKADVGTKEFDELKKDDLLIDFMDKYQRGIVTCL